MRYGIPIFGDRVAPRCPIADGLVIVSVNLGSILAQERIDVDCDSWAELLTLLGMHRVDALVCGGIDRDTRMLVMSKDINVIDNVATTVDEVVSAIAEGKLRRSYGFNSEESHTDTRERQIDNIDCLACSDHVCMRGEPCLILNGHKNRKPSHEISRMLDAARDVTCEEERTLCRLSELIYFCLGMNYRTIGVAYCIDLAEATRIMVGVLRRFFDVIPISCKVGGIPASKAFPTEFGSTYEDSQHRIACNPHGQADILNRIGVDLNVQVGLCMGADCVFAKLSKAPCTTLFVKDKSLANNPIGALYSDYYLKEATSATVRP